jgi:hypothetical protein
MRESSGGVGPDAAFLSFHPLGTTSIVCCDPTAYAANASKGSLQCFRQPFDCLVQDSRGHHVIVPLDVDVKSLSVIPPARSMPQLSTRALKLRSLCSTISQVHQERSRMSWIPALTSNSGSWESQCAVTPANEGIDDNAHVTSKRLAVDGSD